MQRLHVGDEVGVEDAPSAIDLDRGSPVSDQRKRLGATEPTDPQHLPVAGAYARRHWQTWRRATRAERSTTVEVLADGAAVIARPEVHHVRSEGRGFIEQAHRQPEPVR